MPHILALNLLRDFRFHPLTNHLLTLEQIRCVQLCLKKPVREDAVLLYHLSGFGVIRLIHYINPEAAPKLKKIQIFFASNSPIFVFQNIIHK